MNTSRRTLSRYRDVWAFLARVYGTRCVYCHKNLATQIDHVIPYSYARYHGIENLRPCCSWCNLLASDKVFETFDDKYEFLRQSRKKNRGSMLTCSTCLLPYYSMLHRSFCLCPRCYAIEYESPAPRSKPWREWLDTLKQAEVDYRSHFYVADKMREWGVHNIPVGDKIELIVSYMMSHAEGFDTEQLVNNTRDELRRDLLAFLT